MPLPFVQIVFRSHAHYLYTLGLHKVRNTALNMEHFVIYCILLSMAVLIPIVLARPEKNQTTPQNNHSGISARPAAPPLNSFSAWRSVAKRYSSADSQPTQANYTRQLELFGTTSEVQTS